MDTQTINADPVDGPSSGGGLRQARELPARASVDPVVQRVVALLEDHQVATRPDPAVLDDLAAAAHRAGLGAQRERALLAGGTAELLITADGHGTGRDGGVAVVGVAVVVAGHGATDALRGRLRRLGAHREITAVVLATTRSRHRALATEVRQVPVHVVVLAREDRRQLRCSASAGAVATPTGGGPG